MSYFTRHYTSRVKKLESCFLRASLLHPTEDIFEGIHSKEYFKGMHHGHQWDLIKHSEWACTLLEMKEPINPSHIKTFIPFRLVWAGSSLVHSLICQSYHARRIEYRFDLETSSFDLMFYLDENHDLVDREKQKEIFFYLDFDPTFQIKVDELSSSTFKIDQTLTLHLINRRLSISFELIEGDGQFLGHIMRGNRPSQISVKGENRFTSYDWIFFLRSVRRQGKCVIKAKIQMLN